MPLYMDRHDLPGVTAVDIAQAHVRDLQVQNDFDVEFLNYWFDEERQTAFCLARGPNPEAVAAAHEASHGQMPYRVIDVDPEILERFLGGLIEHPLGEPYVATAFRTIVFTDLVGSTALTQRMGDAAAMSVLRVHDRVVREAIDRYGGSEVKHTGDGLMAAYPSVSRAVESAIVIQRELAALQREDEVAPRVRIGMAAGEPVAERDDLFGAAVQLAARLCDRAEAGTVLASSAVRDLALGKGFTFGRRRGFRLKGFDEPVSAFEILWDEPGASSQPTLTSP